MSNLETIRQGGLFGDVESPAKYSPSETQIERAGSFVDNMKLPVHGWFRYSAGFSAEWVESVIKSRTRVARVLDPFVGSGTTLLAAQRCGVPATGCESHPFVVDIARAKLAWNVDEKAFVEIATKVANAASRYLRSEPSMTAPLLLKCYERDSLIELEALRSAYMAFDWSSHDCSHRQLTWLAITAILRECSTAGTATWQYILPNKRKRNPRKPFQAFADKIRKMASDIRTFKYGLAHTDVRLELRDARYGIDATELYDLVITSPPYPNNYDYADATRLEMTYWGLVDGWGDLQDVVRQFLVRSCSQHAAAEKLNLGALLADEAVTPIRYELGEVCGRLDEIRHEKGGKKTYHTMVAAYFADLARIFRSLRAVCVDGADICFVVGDSAPYGIHVPTERWLGELALQSGFKNYSFEQMRARNTKWKNRKHRVPLKEGRLWIQG